MSGIQKSEKENTSLFLKNRRIMWHQIKLSNNRFRIGNRREFFTVFHQTVKLHASCCYGCQKSTLSPSMIRQIHIRRNLLKAINLKNITSDLRQPWDTVCHYMLTLFLDSFTGIWYWPREPYTRLDRPPCIPYYSCFNLTP